MMSRSVIAVVAVLLAAAVLAEAGSNQKADGYQYSYKQADKINSRVVECVKNVPNKADGTNPGDDCGFEGNIILAKGGFKETLPALIYYCMVGKGASQRVAQTTKKCLITEMAKPV